MIDLRTAWTPPGYPPPALMPGLLGTPALFGTWSSWLLGSSKCAWALLDAPGCLVGPSGWSLFATPGPTPAWTLFPSFTQTAMALNSRAWREKSLWAAPARIHTISSIVVDCDVGFVDSSMPTCFDEQILNSV